MRTFTLGASGPVVPNIVLGLMRIKDKSDAEIRELVSTALDEGITMFDHANIYGSDHACEARAGAALDWSAAEREKVILQTKCGIADPSVWFDFSEKHILDNVDASLKALRTDYIDVLLLHRPDSLVEPEEVASAFDTLAASGKVRHFGVSNHTRGQLELLRATIDQPLLANQLQLSLTHAHLVAEGMTQNMQHEQSVVRTDGILDYCRLTSTTIQAWSPYQSGDGSGPFIGNREQYAELNDVLDRLAATYGVTPDGIAAAWITRHPANMQVVLGTTRPERVRAAAAGSELRLGREEWYELFRAAGHIVP
ncbi:MULTISPECIES: aldo/keto reductase [Actinomyces]|uniref:Aldo/keto reductase n=1 Tax=Actinomyces respiraculi TaxID=2744574 RepID=A0A7T0LIZ3_9ACTO|nr:MULTISPECIES: aldo/keto reductase [Actinomyces]QPL04455.1 aldo/keto reductase [Actinomyces respiraculi]